MEKKISAGAQFLLEMIKSMNQSIEYDEEKLENLDIGRNKTLKRIERHRENIKQFKEDYDKLTKEG